MSRKRILIVSGPNGAGKTAFATEFLLREADCPTFVNADLVAAGLDPFRPNRAALQAAKLMLNMIDDYARRGESFAFETTLSGRGLAAKIPVWREIGYWVKLYFLALPTPEIGVARVKQRALDGGHDVPEETVRRRFHAGLRNFELLYRPLVDEWVVYDNLGTVPVFQSGGTNHV